MIDLLLSVEPDNMQAQSLRTLIERAVTRDAYLGKGPTYSAVNEVWDRLTWVGKFQVWVSLPEAQPFRRSSWVASGSGQRESELAVIFSFGDRIDASELLCHATHPCIVISSSHSYWSTVLAGKIVAIGRLATPNILIPRLRSEC